MDIIGFILALANNEGSSSKESDYTNLINKPSINNVELVNNKSLEDLGIKQTYTADDIAFKDGQTFQEKYDNGQLKGDRGEPGTDGAQGQPGKDGYTPQKGIDYFTEEDKQELVQDVLNALPNAEEVSF